MVGKGWRLREATGLVIKGSCGGCDKLCHTFTVINSLQCVSYFVRTKCEVTTVRLVLKSRQLAVQSSFHTCQKCDKIRLIKHLKIHLEYF